MKKACVIIFVLLIVLGFGTIRKAEVNSIFLDAAFCRVTEFYEARKWFLQHWEDGIPKYYIVVNTAIEVPKAEYWVSRTTTQYLEISKVVVRQLFLDLPVNAGISATKITLDLPDTWALLGFAIADRGQPSIKKYCAAFYGRGDDFYFYQLPVGIKRLMYANPNVKPEYRKAFDEMLNHKRLEVYWFLKSRLMLIYEAFDFETHTVFVVILTYDWLSFLEPFKEIKEYLQKYWNLPEEKE